jgi:hypothetical protein
MDTRSAAIAGPAQGNLEYALGEGIDTEGQARQCRARAGIAHGIGAKDRQHEKNAQESKRGNETTDDDGSDFTADEGVAAVSQSKAWSPLRKLIASIYTLCGKWKENAPQDDAVQGSG